MPPTAEELSEHLDRHAPRGPALWLTWLLLAALAIVVLMAGSGPVRVLPWLAVVGLFVLLARIARGLEQRAVAAGEMAMLRHYQIALHRAWRLLPSVSDRVRRRMPAPSP